MTDITPDTLITRLRWLATARLTHPNKKAVDPAETALLLADILEGTNDGYTWVPSALWDDWDALTRDENGQTLYERHISQQTGSAEPSWTYAVGLVRNPDNWLYALPPTTHVGTLEEAEEAKASWMEKNAGDYAELSTAVIVRRPIGVEDANWTLYDPTV